MQKVIEKARVKLGAAFLDVIRPGWAQFIADDISAAGGDIHNPNPMEYGKKRLDMSSGCACVLGHLFGEYAKGAEKVFAMRATPGESIGPLNPGIDQAAYEAGFIDKPSGDSDAVRLSYTVLTDLWRKEVIKRLPKKRTAAKVARELQPGDECYCPSCRGRCTVNAR